MTGLQSPGTASPPPASAGYLQTWAALCACNSRIGTQLDELATVLGRMPDNGPALAILERTEPDIEAYAALVDAIDAGKGAAAACPGTASSPPASAGYLTTWVDLADCNSRIGTHLEELAAALGRMPDNGPALAILERIESDIEAYAALVEAIDAAKGAAA